MSFSPEELEAMRLADAEIDREFEERYIYDQTHAEIDKWLDELAVADALDNKALHSKKQRQKWSAAYRAEHKEEIAAKMAAYYAEHKEEIAAYQRDWRRGVRRRNKALTGHIEMEAIP